MELSGDVHILATLLLGKVPPMVQWPVHCPITSNWYGGVYIFYSQIHVQEMAAQF